MKKILIWALPLSLVFACGDKDAEEIVELKTDKDKLSYALGAANAQRIANDPNAAKQLDFEMVAKGFANNLNANDAKACEQTLQKLFGADYASYDSTYRAAGSECLGKLTASTFYTQMKAVEQLNRVDMKIVATGFKHALNKGDTILAKDAQEKVIKTFFDEVTAKEKAKMAKKDAPFLEAAKKKPNTRVIDGGIVIETIKDGTGGSPTLTDDFDVNYILTNSKGDTLESSYDAGKSLKMNLQGVIPGWTMSFPNLKKGGKYRLYIPSDFAYGDGALCFFIEFINFGKAGSIAPPPQQPQMPY